MCCLSRKEECCSEDGDGCSSSGYCGTCCTADSKSCRPSEIRAWYTAHRHVSTAIFVRLLYLCFVVGVSIWNFVSLHGKVPKASDWLACVFCFIIVLEMLYTTIRRKGKEWKWVSPSTFALLLAILPTIWEMQLDAIRRGSQNTSIANSTVAILANSTVTTAPNSTVTTPPNSTATTASTGLSVQTEQEVVKVIVLVTVFLIMFGKWMAPKGELTAQEHSVLLIGILASGADILGVLDLANTGKPESYAIVVFTAFSWSMLQLGICTTTVKKLPANDFNDKNQNRVERADNQCSISEENGDTTVGEAMTSTAEMSHGSNQSYFTIFYNRFCFYNEIWALVVTMLCQDIPFLALRVFALIRYRDDATFVTFFFCIKNGLAMLLALNRIRIIFKKEYRPWKEQCRKLRNHELTGRSYMVSDNVGFDSQDTLPRPTP